MSDKMPRPDRAHDNDLDVPTYEPATDDTGEETRRPSLYERAGRTAPQQIDPSARDTNATTAFRAADAGETGQAPAVGSRSTYRDEDFASPADDATVVAPAASGVNEEGYFGETDYASEPVAPVAEEQDSRRGTIDFGLLIARVLLGGWLILESLGTFFSLGTSTNMTGLREEFTGYPLAEVLSIAVPTMQLAAGVFLLFGLLTPVAAAVATVVTGFVALHELAGSGAGIDVFSWPETVWLSVVLFGLSLALQFTGPGYYSLDFERSWARRPLASSWIFIVVAIAGLALLWWFGTGINPFA
ncbi:DoxX family protein [Corynebacterium yudongzhengii]|uniref:DoxX family protein n=1 Tax=Corynebacterium yudongzhengii TaxID=2080740 RepID=A0A2U1T9L4_9CORY|nr:DoxX family protein [Corynebacterium yudongzhengii]AWB82064.1 DoxX family protein [Corynebacterium yudongzhengii]PWC02568.1 DoxX family protein [Corynebacterium yudongzhengii]